MKTNACIILIIFLISSCDESTQSEDEKGKYRVFCQSTFPPGNHTPLGWCGKRFKDKSKAEAEMKEHDLEFNHKTYLCEGECLLCDKLDATK